MANIQEYTQRTSLPGPIQTPGLPQAGEQSIAGGLRNFGQDVAEGGDAVTRAITIREVSDSQAQLAKLQSQSYLDWQNKIKTADPGDNTLVENFMKDYDEKSAKIRDNISTRAAQARYDSSNETLRQSFLELSMKSQQHLAGEKALLDKKQELASYSSAVQINPEAGGVFREQMRQSILNDPRFPDRVSAEKAWVAANSELTQNEIRGFIRVDPEMTKAQILAGRWSNELSGDQTREIYNEADMAIKAKRAEDNYAYEQNQRLKRDRNDAASGNIINAIIDGKASVRMIRDNPDLTPERKEHYFNLLANAPVRSSKSSYNELVTRIHLPEGDPRKITSEDQILDEYIATRKLDATYLKRARDELSGKSTIEGQQMATMRRAFLNDAKKQIVTPMGNGIGTLGEDRFFEFQTYVQDQEKAYRDAGKNPAELYRPNSELYQMIPKFTPSLNESVEHMTKQFGTAPDVSAKPIPEAERRRPGESISDYNNRMNSEKKGP